MKIWEIRIPRGSKRSKHWGQSANYQEAMEEWLYRLTARDLRMPLVPVRWYYPRIEKWDLDGAGKPTIPAMIQFFFTEIPSDQQKEKFQRTLRQYITDLSFTWCVAQGWVLVERLSITKRVQTGERTVELHRFASYDTEIAPEITGLNWPKE
jgi:hypothetical protein